MFTLIMTIEIHINIVIFVFLCLFSKFETIYLKEKCMLNKLYVEKCWFWFSSDSSHHWTMTLWLCGMSASSVNLQIRAGYKEGALVGALVGWSEYSGYTQVGCGRFPLNRSGRMVTSVGVIIPSFLLRGDQCLGLSL